tara:strand:+ start:1840 stop:2550 length:711 start_codon:yes stop_codon:yes gene_type:complete
MFKCFHCGECCVNPATQINITVGDLVRLSKEKGISIKSMFGKYVGIVPFQTEEEFIYEMDLGLHIPCEFRSGLRCSVYSARPMNCRLFPLWILVEKADEADSVLTELNKCKGQKLVGESKVKTEKYVNMIKALLLNESKITDSIVKDLGLSSKVDIRKLDGYDAFVESAKAKVDAVSGEGLKRKVAESEKVWFIKEKLKEKYVGVGSKIENALVKKDLVKRIMPIHEIQFAENVLR